MGGVRGVNISLVQTHQFSALLFIRMLLDSTVLDIWIFLFGFFISCFSVSWTGAFGWVFQFKGCVWKLSLCRVNWFSYLVQSLKSMRHMIDGLPDEPYRGFPSEFVDLHPIRPKKCQIWKEKWWCGFFWLNVGPQVAFEGFWISGNELILVITISTTVFLYYRYTDQKEREPLNISQYLPQICTDSANIRLHT